MMKQVALILTALLMAACGGNLRGGEVAHYDFGQLTGKRPTSVIPIAGVDVQAASWLSGLAMHYRLSYADPLRRQIYAESRWAAPPAELLEAFLRRRLVYQQTDPSGPGCRLQLALDELEQRFDDPARSHAVIEVRAALVPPRGTEGLARRTLLIQKPAAAPRAGEGVAATREAVLALAEELDSWLSEVARARPTVVERCRS